MNCPKLSELPEPPAGKTGWPWTKESRRLPSRAPDGDAWPRISVITSSLNQGQFIEETIRSVLLQGYPKLEYIILDGGSQDQSVEIIKKYSRWLTYWRSERDGGQSDAINHGLRRASGEFAAWINSDDMLCENALVEYATKIDWNKNTVYVGDCVYIDREGKTLSRHRGRIHCLEDLVRIRNVWRSGGQIVQPEVLFPRELALSVGSLNPDNHFTMDYEFWGRLLLEGVKFQYTETPFGIFRKHPAQKTQDPLRVTESLLKTAAELIHVADSFSDEKKTELLAGLDAYTVEYQRTYWRDTGRLARLGLPRKIVVQLRRLKALVQKPVLAPSRQQTPS